MIIVRDEPQRDANLAKHGIDFADVDEAFFADALAIPAKAVASRLLANLTA